MFSWVTRSVARRAAVITFACTAFGGALLALVVVAGDRPIAAGWAWLLVVLSALFAAGVAGWAVDRAVRPRLQTFSDFLESQAESPDDVQRLPDMGDDEIGRAARAVNDLLVGMTSVRASLIDRQLELSATQERLRLKEALASKTTELETRLRERALLFDILRAATAATALDDLLVTLVRRLRSSLRVREVALLIREMDGAEERFVIRASDGFDDPHALHGRGIGRGEGVAGEVARTREPVLLRDVSESPQYLAFWGEAARDGSFAAIPMHHGPQQLGILCLTRPADDPLEQEEVRFLGAVADTTALAVRHGQLLEELRRLSTHDELTGLPNRRLLYERLGREIERARRFGHPLGLLAIDIDHFKSLNDNRGHATGDTALRTVAKGLESTVRRVDTAARIGGEEFVLLLPKADAVTGTRVAEKLRRRIEALPVEGEEAMPGGVLTISVGVASLFASDDLDAFLGRADEALYLAKERGRNRVAVWENEGASGPVEHRPGEHRPRA